jgi:hypothetical protein
MGKGTEKVTGPSYVPVIGSRGRMIEHLVEHLSGGSSDRAFRLLVAHRLARRGWA